VYLNNKKTIYLLLDTLTSSDTLKTPDFTKLSSRYPENKHQGEKRSTQAGSKITD
jgi:hypothetical protein